MCIQRILLYLGTLRERRGGKEELWGLLITRPLAKCLPLRQTGSPSSVPASAGVSHIRVVSSRCTDVEREAWTPAALTICKANIKCNVCGKAWPNTSSSHNVTEWHVGTAGHTLEGAAEVTPPLYCHLFAKMSGGGLWPERRPAGLKPHWEITHKGLTCGLGSPPSARGRGGTCGPVSPRCFQTVRASWWNSPKWRTPLLVGSKGHGTLYLGLPFNDLDTATITAYLQFSSFKK